MANKLKITLVRSFIGRPEEQRLVAKALGLRKMQSSVIQDDTPSIRGSIRRIEHLLKVEEVNA
jgi:large subunit ribosomal protein L30